MDRRGNVIGRRYVYSETEKLEQNLMGEDEIEDGGDNSDDDIADKQDDELVI